MSYQELGGIVLDGNALVVEKKKRLATKQQSRGVLVVGVGASVRLFGCLVEECVCWMVANENKECVVHDGGGVTCETCVNEEPNEDVLACWIYNI